MTGETLADEPFPARTPGLTYAAIRAELAREIAARARTYPGQVDKGRMTATDAAFEQALAAAWLADFDQAMACAPLVPQHSFTWTARRDGLGRELDRRARFYPRWIESARLTKAAAAHQLACLEALLDHYDGGWGWTCPGDSPPLEQRTAEDQAWIDAAWDTAWRTTRRCRREQPIPQKELAL